MVILYSDNQLIDPELWDIIFSPILSVGINKFLNNNAQNITYSLLRIGMFIKQYFFGDKQTADLLILEDCGVAI